MNELDDRFMIAKCSRCRWREDCDDKGPDCGCFQEETMKDRAIESIIKKIDNVWLRLGTGRNIDSAPTKSVEDRRKELELLCYILAAVREYGREN